MPPTLYVDVHFGSATLADLQTGGAALGIQVESFRSHRQDALDPDQLYFAARRGWTILTRDAGFRRIHDLWYVVGVWRPSRPRRPHASILWIASDRVPDRDVVTHVLAFLGQPRSLTDELFILQTEPVGVSWRRYRPFARTPRAQVR